MEKAPNPIAAEVLYRILDSVIEGLPPPNLVNSYALELEAGREPVVTVKMQLLGIDLREGSRMIRRRFKAVLVAEEDAGE